MSSRSTASQTATLYLLQDEGSAKRMDNMSVTTCNFLQSFVTFRLDFERKPPKTVSHKPPYNLNSARIPLECVCRVFDKQSGNTQTFVLGASCKTERVGVDRDIWTEPNSDFAPIFCEDRFLNIKTYARAGIEVNRYPPGSGRQSDRQSGCIEDVFDNVRIDIAECRGEELVSAEEIVTAVLQNVPLVAQTQLETDRYSVRLEYPVKTINANERDMVWQTDTGPVLFPDLSRKLDDILEGLELAYAAFNCAEWVEFLVRVPTTIAEDVSVYHYSRAVRMDSKNCILAVV